MTDHIPFGGCRVPDRPVSRVCNGRELSIARPPISYVDCLSVADNQVESSCTGRGIATRGEVGVFRALRERVQLDAYAIWERGCDMFSGGDLSGGLTLFQASCAAANLKIIPPGCGKRVELTSGAIHEAMQTAPLVVANEAHDGWQRNQLNPVNGAVSENVPYRLGENGHCTCLIALTELSGFWMAVLAGSWGSKYGPLHGLNCMTMTHFLATSLDQPILYDIPDSWWRDTSDWRKYIIGTGDKQAPK